MASRLRRYAAEDQVDVGLRGQLGVAATVPQGPPQHGTGERTGDGGQPGHHRGLRPGVQPDLGVAQVLVVDHDRVWPGDSDEIRHRGTRARDLDLDPAVPNQLIVAVGIQAEHDPVLPQRGPPVRCGLLDDRGGDQVLLVGGDLEPQGVDPGGLQPLRRPAGQVAAGGAFQALQQVGQGGVAEGVRGEVLLHAGQEGVPADVGHQLPQQRGAFGVGDLVEVQLDGVQVHDVGGHRMRGGQLVLPVGRGLGAAAERRPGQLGIVCLLRDGEGSRPGGEGLLQPEVVPPAHGHQVAEPHVRQLVQDRVPPVVAGGGGDLAAEQVLVAQGDAADVLHRPAVVLRHEDLVVLAERVANAEPAFEHLEAALGDREDLRRVQVRRDRLPAEDRGRDVPVDADWRPGHGVVVAGDQGGQVGGDRQRLGESGLFQAWPGRGSLGYRRVGHHRPAVGRDHRQGESGLEVGLLEAGVHPPRIGRLELGVQVVAPGPRGRRTGADLRPCGCSDRRLAR